MNIDFTKLPKALCDTLSMNFNQHQFLLALATGEQVAAFAVPPELMKAFAKGLNEKIAEYETKFGPISAWGPRAASRVHIQIS